MNRSWCLSVILFALLASLSSGLYAQEQGTVTTLEFDGKMAVFSVEASAFKVGDVTSTALETLFLTLLDQGVAGVNNGQRFMEIENVKWKENFFKSKNPPYMSYVKGVQTEGNPLKSEVGDFRATVLVRVNIEFFIRQLKAYGIMRK